TLFKIEPTEDLPYRELLFAGLRRRSMHIWDYRPCLMTLAHRSEHVDAFVQAMRSTLFELQSMRLIPGQPARSSTTTPNVEGAEARQGRDRNGKPGWFVPDSNRPGQFVQVPGPTRGGGNV
ncbi:MAG: hypothetical protein AAFP90_17440, partial [Planctomycetota bacterium]